MFEDLGVVSQSSIGSTWQNRSPGLQEVQRFCSHIQALELFEKKVQKFQRALSKILRWLCYKVGKFQEWMFRVLVFLSYSSWWLSINWIGRFLRPRFSPFDLVDLTALDLWLVVFIIRWPKLQFIGCPHHMVLLQSFSCSGVYSVVQRAILFHFGLFMFVFALFFWTKPSMGLIWL